jgi:pimeloyl-ACP methyl ester carboxylesterase
MIHIYCLSGLGADKVVFAKFDFGNNEVHYIDWEIPEKKESISTYALKLSRQIHHEKPVLIGLSFGGMMSIEIAKIIPVQLVILISSIKSVHELPYWMRLCGKLYLDKLFPMRSFKLIEPLENYNLGVETQEERDMVNAYRKNINRTYSDWAINKVLNWNNECKPDNLINIHCYCDRILPIKKIKADHIIPNSGHFMIMNRAVLVNDLVKSILS